MEPESILDRLVKDIVTSAYYATFDAKKISDLGLQITINQGANKVRFVGDPANPIYPEILVWKPNAYSPSTGKAVLAACIETRKSMPINVDRWRALASLGIIVNVVVPWTEVATAKILLLKNNLLPLIHLQQYKYITESKTYEFINIP